MLEGEDLSEDIKAWIEEVVERVVTEHTMGDFAEEWDLAELVTAMGAIYSTGVSEEELHSLDREAIVAEFLEDASTSTPRRRRSSKEWSPA